MNMRVKRFLTTKNGKYIYYCIETNDIFTSNLKPVPKSAGYVLRIGSKPILKLNFEFIGVL